ncbi:MAG: preprotein translocase subunit SecG [Patescibacteria group bacterium]|nr:preprotein translocase subunit SecG [Patescibacteria group bacterium]MDD4610668.1 preprotein translocase subunit SecG [Patescibacteria group bacterium]
MDWIKILKIVQIISAVGLMLAILLQNKGAGLSGIFGGNDNVFRTKRGLDKTLFQATIVIAIIFFAVSLLRVLI